MSWNFNYDWKTTPKTIMELRLSFFLNFFSLYDWHCKSISNLCCQVWNSQMKFFSSFRTCNMSSLCHLAKSTIEPCCSSSHISAADKDIPLASISFIIIIQIPYNLRVQLSHKDHHAYLISPQHVVNPGNRLCISLLDLTTKS